MKLSKKQKEKLMGQKVIVTHVFTPAWKYNEKYHIIEKINARPAWITGFGIIKKGYTIGDFENKHFIQTGFKRSIKVRFHYKEKEINIPIDGFQVLDFEVFPYCQADEKASKQMKEEYKQNKINYPRDEKGRFISLQ